MRLLFAAALCCGLVMPAVVDAQSFRAACKVKTLCAGVEPGGGRVVACLREHKTELSVPCRLAIAEFFLNKKGRGGGKGGAGRGPNDRGPSGPDGGPDDGPDGPAPDGPDQGPPPTH